MPVIVMGTTEVAARLLRYTVKDKPGQSEPRVLHAAGVHCRPETAEREFAATRRRHGTQGATRKAPAKYKLPGAREIATHVRRTRPNGRRYWALAKDGEEATHVRSEGEVVRQAEARHIIVSFGPDEVNHDDPEQVAAAFGFVMKMQRTLRSGVQAHIVGQADGKGNAFHLHIVENATLYADMEVDGKLYSAGRKLAGELTDIDRVRERADRFLFTHGHEYGLKQQRLRSVSERKKDTRNQRDRRMAASGTLSNHDEIREAFEIAMDDARATDLDAWKAVMAEHGVAVTEPGWRRGNPPKVPRLSYQLADMSTPVRAKTLGQHYDYASAAEMLEANLHGRPRIRRAENVKAGGPRPAAQPTDDELTVAQGAVALLARVERDLRAAEHELDRWVAARADHEGVALGDVWNRLPETHAARMRVMQLWNRLPKASTTPEEALTSYQFDLDAHTEVAAAALTPAREPVAVVAESAPKAVEAELSDLVIVNEALVQYGLYLADSSAMYRAGIEPRRISAARESWQSLSSDEQRDLYEHRKSAVGAAQEVDPTAESLEQTQSHQRRTIGSLEDWPVEDELPKHTEMLERTLVARQSVAEESPQVVAARRERERRDAVLRSLLNGSDESAHNEDDRELGA